MKKTYNLFTGEELAVAELIQQRRLQMLVHSCLYYELDTNLISDKQWGDWAVELVKLQTDYPAISKEVRWAEEFKDWDGTTGAFLPLRDEWVMKQARRLILLVRGAQTRGTAPVTKPGRSLAKEKSKAKRLF